MLAQFLPLAVGESRLGECEQLLHFVAHITRLGAARIGGDRDAKATERARVVTTEKHLQIERPRTDRHLWDEDRLVGFAETIRARPAGLRIPIRRGCGAGGVFAEVVLCVALGRLGELHWLGIRADLEFSQEEVAAWTFVVAHAGAVRGQTFVRQRLQADRRHALREFGELEVVGVAL